MGISDRPSPLPLPLLARWILDEASSRRTVFGVPASLFPNPIPRGPDSFEFFGQRLATRIGPAAGPHTQLSQNIALAFLCGGRFLELKTAQIRDDIEVKKPCIDAADLGLNCEWSQEQRLPQTLREYLKAELLVHLLRCELLGQKLDAPLDFAFNASVGYDLKGLRSRKMRGFVSSLLAPREPLRDRLAEELRSLWPLAGEAMKLPPATTSLTLSTMHGCPSREIEDIATFLLEAFGVPLLLKLNPTVLGKRAVLGILHDELGFGALEVPDEAFEHDPGFDEVVGVVRAVRDKAQGLGLGFGLKLTNTLELRRPECSLHESERVSYMSGRALFPLMLRVAAVLREQFGSIPMAAAGGLNASNVALLRNCGLGPLTLCTELLRPGGYAELSSCVEALAAESARSVSVEEAAAMAAAHPLRGRGSSKRPRKPQRPLAPFDCNEAPCSLACPARQEAPRYLRALWQGDPQAALAAALERNPLPSITGHVCPAPCEAACVRGHTGAPIAIREIKRLVSVAELRPAPAVVECDAKVAIIGTGPGGLAAAAFLSRRGVRVRMFEEGQEAGGIPARAIPAFRLPQAAISLDLSRVLEHPLVDLVVEKNPLAKGGLGGLAQAGFAYVVLSTGAGPGRRLRVPGEDLCEVVDGLEFLEGLRRGQSMHLGNKVLVVGGGSSAVDAARAARKILGRDGSVEIVYRRSRQLMPAHSKELSLAEEEGIRIRELAVPVRFEGRQGQLWGLVVMRAVLEDKGEGRPRPIPLVGSEEVLEVSTAIVAIGQAGSPVTGLEAFADGRLKTDERCRCDLRGVYAVGDARHGPATVIQAIADARAASNDILEQLGISCLETELSSPDAVASLLEHKARSSPKKHRDLALGGAQEAGRCLSCDVLCGLCAIVCPNRANVIYETRSWALPVVRLEAARGEVNVIEAGALEVSQRFQIANLGEPCNACGNCATFCPSSGAPYLDKPRVWLGRRPLGARGVEVRRTATGYRALWEDDLGLATLVKRGDQLRFKSGPFDVSFGPELKVRKAICRAQAQGEILDLRSVAQVMVLCEGLLMSAGYLFPSQHSSVRTLSGVSGESYSPSGKRAPAARNASRRAKKAPRP
jgi:putative selenate reductase